MEDASQPEETPKEQLVEEPKEKWYAPLTHNTPLSRVLAAVLFVVLPFVGFWLGIGYLQVLGVDESATVTPTPTEDQLDLKYAELFTSLPPDPGEAGKATNEGIDTDNDGVRDDVQRWIVMTYPDSAKTRAALVQRAIDLQNAILYADDAVRSVQLAHNSGRSIECLYYTNEDTAYEMNTRLKSEVLNTKERSDAFITYNSHLGGQVFSQRHLTVWKTSCDFDVDAMDDAPGIVATTTTSTADGKGVAIGGGTRVTVAHGVLSLVVPQGMGVIENLDGRAIPTISISELDTLNDDNHNNAAVGIRIYDLSSEDVRELLAIGMDSTLYNLATALIGPEPESTIDAQTIEGRDFLVVFDSLADDTIFLTQIDDNLAVSFSGSPNSSLSDDDIRDMLATLEVNT